MREPEGAPVLVVGAGPTGLMLACELQRRGVGCRVIDALPEVLPWDRATVVHPRSLEVLESLGLLDAFLVAGAPQRGARLYSGGAVLGEIDLATCGSRHGFNLGISEQVTEAILTDHLTAAGGHVERGGRLVGLAPGPDRVLATIERDGERETVAADWVVGCDGLHSVTRQAAGIELLGHDIAQPWAVFDVTLAGWTEAEDVNQVFLDEPPVILTALPARRWRAYLRPSSPDSDLVAEARATIHRYQPHVVFENVADPRRFHCHTKVAERYRAGRILLAGDAAHVCSPAQGHGMNSGIQDAFNLGWKLALVCAGHCGPGLLGSYEAERRPVAQHITRSGDEAEGAQEPKDGRARAARDATLRAALADPATRHHEAVAEAELDIDYAGSPIVMGQGTPALRPGQRLADDCDVTLPGGRTVGLQQLTARTGHSALLLAGPAVRPGELAALEQRVRTAADPALVEQIIVICAEKANGGEHTAPRARIGAATCARLGVDGPLLVVVRPDGHLGLVAGDDPAGALAGYQARLCIA